jgi:hypothetical protein
VRNYSSGITQKFMSKLMPIEKHMGRNRGFEEKEGREDVQ